jgi:hypothetical protein
MAYNLDKPIADYSISQLVTVYNDIARYNGTPLRSSTFRDKATAIKAVENALVQANATPEVEEETVPDAREQHTLKDQLQESLAETETEAAPVATGKRRGRKTSITGNEVIVPLFTKYPLPAGGKPAARWANYTDGMTIDQFGVALRDRKQAIADVRWYVRKGHVKLA